jgi:hypothetical protein
MNSVDGQPGTPGIQTHVKFGGRNTTTPSLPDRHYVFGIAAGLAVMTSIGMVVLTIRTWVGQSGNAWYSLAAPGGFTLGNAVFAYYFASVKSVVPLKIIPRTEQLISWNRALLELRQR